jgi:hypothetical protein
MNQKTEGTAALDGILDGKIPDRDEVEDRLREWISFAASINLQFNLEIDGNSFNLLADNKPFPAKDIEPDLTSTVSSALSELLRIFNKEERRRVFSTIRSIEYRKGVETQTLFTVGPDGEIHTRSRTAEAQTTAAPRPYTRKEKIRTGVIVGASALVAFAISALFVDYGSLFNRTFERVKTFRAAGLEVENKIFHAYFTVEKKTAVGGGKTLLLVLKRGEAFPKADSDFEQLITDSPGSISARVTIEALARGYVRCEFYDQQGKFLSFYMQRISGLRQNQTIELNIPLPSQKRPERLIITY